MEMTYLFVFSMTFVFSMGGMGGVRGRSTEGGDISIHIADSL